MFNLSVDKKKIKELLDQFYNLSFVNIRFISYDRKIRIGNSNAAHENFRGYFCSILRQDKLANERCRNCDQDAFKRACSNHQIYIYKCHAGLTEVMVPVMFENRALGYFIMGKLLKGPPTARLWQEVWNKCKDYEINGQELEKAFFKLNVMDDIKIQAAAYFVNMCSKYIYLSKMVSIDELQPIGHIKQYVNDNLEKDISITSLSNYLNISKSHLSHMIKSKMGMNFTQYLHAERVEKAKTILKETNMAIKEISLNTGFKNQNYFNKIFKRLTGFTPKLYRECKKLKNNMNI